MDEAVYRTAPATSGLLINFLIVSSNGLGQVEFFYFSVSTLFYSEYINKTNKTISEIMWFILPALTASTYPYQDVKKSVSEPRRELCLPARNPFKDFIYIYTYTRAPAGR